MSQDTKSLINTCAIVFMSEAESFSSTTAELHSITGVVSICSLTGDVRIQAGRVLGQNNRNPNFVCNEGREGDTFLWPTAIAVPGSHGEGDVLSK